MTFSWRKREQRQCSRSEKRSEYAAFQCAASFHWWKIRKAVKSLSRSQRKSTVSWIGNKEETKHRTEWCAEINMREVWKRQQIFEGARKMHRTKILVKKIEKWRRSHFVGRDFTGRPSDLMRGKEWDRNR